MPWSIFANEKNRERALKFFRIRYMRFLLKTPKTNTCKHISDDTVHQQLEDKLEDKGHPPTCTKY